MYCLIIQASLGWGAVFITVLAGWPFMAAGLQTSLEHNHFRTAGIVLIIIHATFHLLCFLSYLSMYVYGRPAGKFDEINSLPVSGGTDFNQNTNGWGTGQQEFQGVDNFLREVGGDGDQVHGDGDQVRGSQGNQSSTRNAELHDDYIVTGGEGGDNRELPSDSYLDPASRPTSTGAGPAQGHFYPRQSGIGANAF